MESTTIAGIQIPSRIQMAHPQAGGGLRFAFSSGQFISSPSGAKKYVSKTTQFAHGKKFTRTETTILHPDGRTEVVIEGNDFVERRYSQAPPREDVNPQPEAHMPWYYNAWKNVKEVTKKIGQCHNPCDGTILVR